LTATARASFTNRMKHGVVACLALILSLVAQGPAVAQDQTCPPPPDHSAALTDLIRAAQQAEDERSGRMLSNEMWALWSDAPDSHAQDLLDEGMSRRNIYDYDGAMKAFEALIAYCPDYAEGYNQRAFVHFLREDFAAALPDLDRAIDLSPRHVAAITGRALTLSALERKGEAVLALRKALDMNPWLGERHLLPVLEAAEEQL